MPDFDPVLLKRINAKASPWLDAYSSGGGYSAVTKALNDMTSAQVIDVVKNSGLRGRGGAGFPCGVKWTFLPKDHPGAIYLCVNADESEPCTFNNRILMEQDPHQVLEGIILACVTHIVGRGADWFKTIGIPPDPKNPKDSGSYGPKLYCISGHVNTPCCVELPLGITVRELVDKHGGGVWKGRKAKGCIPGGISMGIMTEAEFDTPLDFNGPGKVGCLGLGTAAVTIFDETTSIVDILYNICRFFAHESCGQCTPCREGTGWMMKMLERIRQGQGRKEDLEILDEVAKSIGIMPGTTICDLADGAGWPDKQAIAKFRPDVKGYIRGGTK